MMTALKMNSGHCWKLNSGNTADKTKETAMRTNFKALTHFATAAKFAANKDAIMYSLFLELAADRVIMGRCSVCR